MRGRAYVIDAILGVLLGWIGWIAAHVVWNDPGPVRRPPGGPRGGRRGEEGSPWRWIEVSPGIGLAMIALVLGVAIRRRRPRIGFGLVVGALVAYRALGAGPGPVYAALALVVFSMATALPAARWAPLTAALIAIPLGGHWSETAFGLLNPGFYAELFALGSVAVLPSMFALLHRTRRDNEQQLREQDRRRYADEERLRIARDVHDVVGHSLSVITMQAGVARHLLDKRAQIDPGSADPQLAESLDAIRRTSKDALAELRTTIEVFRDPGGAPHGLRPGLDRVDELVAALVGAGRRVTVERDPIAQPALPVAVDQAAFRIIQEALTNVVRHADDAAARVRIERRVDQLVVEIGDDGPARALPTPGNGIAGMTERARGVGGRVDVETLVPHGLRIRAVLPLSAQVRV